MTPRALAGVEKQCKVFANVAVCLTLVLGGARSGKSRYAENLIAAIPPPWLYVATAQADRGVLMVAGLPVHVKGVP